MPAQYTYPGIYVEEIPSGVRPVAGASTSDTAFVDFFRKGPVNQPVRLTSFGDFEREFGGLDARSEASYAIRQYYLNGGTVAWAVRVHIGAATADRTLPTGAADQEQDTLRVQAASPGSWGNDLRVAVDHATALPGQFNLVVREVTTVGGEPVVAAAEVHRNLDLTPASSRYAVDVVGEASRLVVLEDLDVGERPNATGADVVHNPGEDAFLQLGEEGAATVGTDGDEPGSNAWNANGAGALAGSPADRTGLHALDKIAPFIFNLLCIPAAAELGDNALETVYTDALAYCRDKRAFLLVDLPASIGTPAEVLAWPKLDGLRSKDNAVYFPRLTAPDPLNGNRPRSLAASGTLAGVYARTDANRGVWKAPAGTEAGLRGAQLAATLTDLDNGGLNPFGVNVLRNFPIFGNVAWGARTMDGADQKASEWKYVPVRRTALFIEESLYQGLKWVVFEPNGEALWSEIRLNVGAFLQRLFRQGAFKGTTPREAYFVRCDAETTTQSDIDLGIVNILVGFAPLKPAEFVVIKLQQMAGQVEA